MQQDGVLLLWACTIITLVNSLLSNQPSVRYAVPDTTRNTPYPSNTILDRLDPKADYDEGSTPTLDALTLSTHEKKPKQSSVLSSLASDKNSNSETTSFTSSPSGSNPTSTPSASDPAELEEEASSEGAFNPATGEINWDCPCLGGMAHGPCGEQFRAAFSCFVFSEEEPKGMDCIDKFKGMQDCFREHPDVYAAELEGDDDEELDQGLEDCFGFFS